MLIDHGADVNARDSDGQTALHGAAFRGWNDVIKLLVKSKATVNVADNNGKTPLDAAMGRIYRRARLGATEVRKETGALLEKLAAEQQL